MKRSELVVGTEYAIDWGYVDRRTALGDKGLTRAVYVGECDVRSGSSWGRSAKTVRGVEFRTVPEPWVDDDGVEQPGEPRVVRMRDPRHVFGTWAGHILVRDQRAEWAEQRKRAKEDAVHEHTVDAHVLADRLVEAGVPVWVGAWPSPPYQRDFWVHSDDPGDERPRAGDEVFDETAYHLAQERHAGARAEWEAAAVKLIPTATGVEVDVSFEGLERIVSTLLHTTETARK